MRRTAPLLISAMAGCVLIASRFIPFTQSWGEVEAIWFDVLAAIAFILGGGNLLKLHLKKISDRAAGWGYSVIILVSFLATLIVGALKLGVPPAQQQEAYGRSYVPLSVADLPDGAVVRVPGVIPPRVDGEPLPASVRRQFSQQGGDLLFRGWMSARQQSELADYGQTLAWQCAVERLFDNSQPPAPLRGKIEYLADHRALAFRGLMTDADRQALLALGGNTHWSEAVARLFEKSRKESQIEIAGLPKGFAIPASMQSVLSYDPQTHRLAQRGPMSTAMRDQLKQANFPLIRPLSETALAQFRKQIESRGPALDGPQVKTLEAVLKKTWLVDKLQSALNAAGKGAAPDTSACDLLAAANQGGNQPDVAKPAAKPEDQALNARQISELARFAEDPTTSVDALAERLRAAGPFNAGQSAALASFFAKIPTVGERNLDLCLKLLREGPLSREQRDMLLADYREQARWRRDVGRLFAASHATKYPWSGQYVAQGSAFGWIYEFVFKPLQATMFALLAFYVSSAAFRAFRAKNTEALLLLATAFLVLLGQTFAGQLATAWIPADSPFAVFKIERLMALVGAFQTAGQRAIMIGIALGIASTSLKILLGIDRSYLGTGEV